MSSDETTLREALYERVCESYHAVDDFRMKLLGLLPVATGTGVFLLLNGNAELLGEDDGRVSDALLAIGVFGFLFTVGLFAYELFGIKKCHHLIKAGRRLELDLGLSGQFRSRPRDLAGFINEPFASAIIYPASMAAWMFLALSLKSELAAPLVASVVFAIGFVATLFGARRLKQNDKREDLVLQIVNDHGQPMPVDKVRKAASHKGRAAPDRQTGDSRGKPRWVDAVLEQLKERGELEEVKSRDVV